MLFVIFWTHTHSNFSSFFSKYDIVYFFFSSLRFFFLFFGNTHSTKLINSWWFFGVFPWRNENFFSLLVLVLHIALYHYCNKNIYDAVQKKKNITKWKEQKYIQLHRFLSVDFVFYSIRINYSEFLFTFQSLNHFRFMIWGNECYFRLYVVSTIKVLQFSFLRIEYKIKIECKENLKRKILLVSQLMIFIRVVHFFFYFWWWIEAFPLTQNVRYTTVHRAMLVTYII